MPKTILFDLDGTLIDSTEAILEAFDGACEDVNSQKFPHDKIKKLIGYPLDEMFSMLAQDCSKALDFVQAYKIRYRPISKPKTTLLPRAKEAVELATTFARCAVVTTKTAQYSQELLDHLGIGDSFEILIGRDSVEYPKPHPEPILKALEFMKIPPSNDVFMIGDTKLDLLCATAAGVCGIGVLCGYTDKKELSNYTQVVTYDAFEAVSYIRSL